MPSNSRFATAIMDPTYPSHFDPDMSLQPQQMVAAFARTRHDNMLWEESPGTMAAAQAPSHFENITPHTALSEDLTRTVSLSGIDSGLGENAGAGSVADTSTFDLQASGLPALQTQSHVSMIPMFAPNAQPLTIRSQPAFPHGSGIELRQQHEYTQTLIDSGYVLGANLTVAPITPGAFMTPPQQIATAVTSIRLDNMLWEGSPGTVAAPHGPSHFVNLSPLTALPENPTRTLSPLGIYSGLGEDADTGSVADTSTLGLRASGPPALQTRPHVNMFALALGAQPLTMQDQPAFLHGSGIEQRQQPGYAQTLIAGGSVLGENQTAGPIAPGAFMTPPQQITTAITRIRRDNMLWEESPGTVAAAHGPSDFVSLTPLTALAENLSVSPSGIYSGLEEDAGTGSVADTSTLDLRAFGPPALQALPHVNMIPMFAHGAQPLAMQDQSVFLHGRGIEQRQQQIQLDDAQKLMAGGSVLGGANRTADPITPGARGGTARDNWTGTLQYCDGDLYQVQGVATNGIGDPMFSIWPSTLKFQLDKTAISTLDVQAWILKNRTPVARIKAKPEDRPQFGHLVEALRSSGCYALVDLEMGSFQLLLVPLNEDLLCALFDRDSRTMRLPKPRSQPCSRPKAASTLKPKQRSSSKAMRTAPTPQQANSHRRAQPRAPYNTGDPRIRSPRMGKAISSAPVRVLLLRFRQQADGQGTLQRPGAQQSQRVASHNMLSSGGGVDDSRKIQVTTSGVANPSDGPGSTLSVEGNGGPWPGHENKMTNVGAADAVFGDANMTHIPSASLEAKEDFDMGEYGNWEGSGDNCWELHVRSVI